MCNRYSIGTVVTFTPRLPLWKTCLPFGSTLHAHCKPTLSGKLLNVSSSVNVIGLHHITMLCSWMHMYAAHIVVFRRWHVFMWVNVCFDECTSVCFQKKRGQIRRIVSSLLAIFGAAFLNLNTIHHEQTRSLRRLPC